MALRVFLISRSCSQRRGRLAWSCGGPRRSREGLRGTDEVSSAFNGYKTKAAKVNISDQIPRRGLIDNAEQGAVVWGHRGPQMAKIRGNAHIAPV